MNSSSLAGVLWRQRLFVIPAAVAAVLFCVFVYVTSPPTYRASGSVVLMSPPPLPNTQMGGPTVPPEWQNPYARIGNLSVVVDILARVMGSEPVLAHLQEEGFVGVPMVAGNRGFYSGPIVDVTAEAPTAEAAINDVNLLISELDAQLAQLQQQQGTADPYLIKSDVVITPDRATTVFSGTFRLLIVAAGASVILVVGVGLLADRLRKRKPEPTSELDPAANDRADVPPVRAAATGPAPAAAGLQASPNGEPAKRRLSAAGQADPMLVTQRRSSTAERRGSNGRRASNGNLVRVRRGAIDDSSGVIATSDLGQQPAHGRDQVGSDLSAGTDGVHDPLGAVVDRSV